VAERSEGWVDNDAAGGPVLPWGELWRARELVAILALRDVKVRYKQAAFGVAWVVLQPVITVVAFTLVFHRLANVSTAGVPYPAFALAGLLSWNYFTSCASRGSEVLVSNTALVTKVYFPRIIAPVASLAPPLIDLGIGLVLLAVFCVAYGITPGPQLLLLPVWLLLLVVTALGVVALLAALNVRYRDVRQIVAPALQALLFLSPVAYSARSLSGAGQLLYSLNPVVGVLELGRWVLLDAPWPGPSLFVSVAAALVLAAGGVLYFQGAQRQFADVI
jgi:ABC-2 type transport system permease protein/lipopolysaccharide transport system permease protein